MKRIVILNPKSKHGHAQKVFESKKKELINDLGEFTIYYTTGPKDCTEKVRNVLLKKEFDQILIAGGDGSVNEAVNGYFQDGKAIKTKIPIGIINLGTGGDFIKSVEKKSKGYKEALIKNTYRMIDCGVTTLDKTKDPIYFINISSIGMGGEVNRQLKESSFQMGIAAYFYHTLSVLYKYDPPNCKIKYRSPDGKWNEFEFGLTNLFVCNSEYNGGGMWWAPKANFEDGVFDIVLVSKVPKLKLVATSHKVYTGKVSSMPGVKEFQATEVLVIPERTVSQEIDGEVREIDFLKKHDFYFKILPKSIPVIM
ncbi:MAG: YegS/Rv2252/BmrU family lipid kinase [Leptospiraceae bacterium]|nr:YegS/Rv2252/BmrU family lipid kinase [Leptospiraceae bacterium]MCK6381801.1 YegS/Rv2252/BmrU family lipid kinase [Leptospiraceae bacterium]NUM42762.1 YegS/Rv2252/BmrU family lipid kinase [Leptospiraceae bacterium]